MLTQFLRSAVPVLAAPVIQGYSTATIVAGTSTTINKPTGTVDGDLLYFFAGSSSTRANTPSGFTSLVAVGTKKAAYKVASSEPASYTITTSTSQDTSIIMVRISGGRYLQSSTFGTNGASPITIQQTGATSSYSLVLMLTTATSTGVIFTAPSTYTTVYSDNTVGASIGVYSLIVPTSPVVSQSVTMSSGSGSGFHSVIYPI